MNTCSNCGFVLGDEMEFCPVCGTPANSDGSVSYEEQSDEDDSAWYDNDIFQAALSPLMRSFDNGRFFLSTAKTLIDIVVTTFLLSQPFQAYLLMENHSLAGSTKEEKTIELISAIIWVIIAAFSFGYWMKRNKKLDRLFGSSDEFVVLPMSTYILQWIGEWLGIVLIIGGIFAVVVSSLGVETSSFTLNVITYYGWMGGIIAILLSVIVIFVFRLIAEKLRALVAIANNTKRLRDNEEQEVVEDEHSSESHYNVFYLLCIFMTIGFMLVAMFIE